ncbi:MAG: hypothetical protein GX595_08475 [Lentisphaerae bacterium]|nr:hypothetical protein [Lentisphaerota bacterium]
MVAANESARRRVRAGELLYTIESHDTADRLEEMARDRASKLRRQIADLQAAEGMNAAMKKAQMAAMEESLSGARLHALVRHSLEFGSFRVHLKFDEGKRRALATREDDRDLMSILKEAGGEGREDFSLYPRIQRLRRGDQCATVYDLCRGGQIADTEAAPRIRLPEESILDLGFFTAHQIPPLPRYECTVSRDKKASDVIRVEFVRRRGSSRLVYAVDGAKGYRLAGCWSYEGLQLVRSEEFSYALFDGALFSKQPSAATKLRPHRRLADAAPRRGTSLPNLR